MDNEAENFDELKKTYKVQSLDVGKTQLRFYPNNIEGERKLSASFGIMDKSVEGVMEEISSSLEHNVREVSPHLFNQILIQHAKTEQKNVIYYMYADDKGPSVSFKSLSLHPLFLEDSVFIAMKDPPAHIFDGLKKEFLPSVGVVPKLDESFEEGHIQQSNIDAAQGFNNMLVHLAKACGKTEELEEMYAAKPSGNKKRTYGEITSDADFQERCLSHKKGCAIGLLPAVTVIDYERENFDQHVKTLANMDAKAKAMPVYYAWINVTCHPEWLKYFEIDQF